MAEIVRISNSQNIPNLEVVYNLVIKLHVPYSEKEVTVMLNPNIQDYQEKSDRPGAQVRQYMLTTPTDQTKKIKFDFESNKIKVVQVENEKYQIELMQIGKEEVQGQEFPFFEFSISKV
ncbi:MAG: hypothetical protein HQ580_00110 [Planctomycetes bacterium]|nr:hypothetical protein [Planctomycetota bacterium]